MSEIQYKLEKQGQLSYMIMWQSLDGRVEIEYFDDLETAQKMIRHLRVLGRNPKLWRGVIL